MRLFTPGAAPTLAAAVLFTTLASAQTAPAAPSGDPLDASSSVPALHHPSTFSAYRRLADAKLASWKEVNERVEHIGGWRSYAKEACAPDAAKPAHAGHPAQPEGAR